MNYISSLTQTSLSNTVIDNPQTKAPDERILQILEYLNSDTVWYVSSVLQFFKLHCVWHIEAEGIPRITTTTTMGNHTYASMCERERGIDIRLSDK